MNEIFLFALISMSGMMIQAFVGFAGSLVAIPLLTMFLPPQEAVPAYNLVMITVNVLLFLEARNHVDWPSVRRLLLGGLVGIPIGALGLKHLPAHAIGLMICLLTFLFGLLFAAKIRLRLPAGARTQFLVGLISGLLGGSISESGPPVVIYALARRWDKDLFRATLLTYFLFLAATANASYWFLGLFTSQGLTMSAAALGPTLLGAGIGVILKNRVQESSFRRAVLAIVLLVSVFGMIRHIRF